MVFVFISGCEWELDRFYNFLDNWLEKVGWKVFKSVKWKKRSDKSFLMWSDAFTSSDEVGCDWGVYLKSTWKRISDYIGAVDEIKTCERINGTPPADVKKSLVRSSLTQFTLSNLSSSAWSGSLTHEITVWLRCLWTADLGSSLVKDLIVVFTLAPHRICTFSLVPSVVLEKSPTVQSRRWSENI